MPHFPKRPRLTFEPNFQTQSETQGLVVAEAPVDEEEEEETASVSSCSFTFSYPPTSSSSPSSPVIPDIEEEEEEHEEEEEEVEEEEEEEKGEEEKEEEEQQPAAQSLSPPRSPQSSGSSSPSSSTSRSTSDGDSSSQDEDTSSLQLSIDTESLSRDSLDEKVTDLVHFMILKYRLRKPITEAEMLKLVIKGCKSEYPVIFKKACRCLEVISGIDVKEVDPTTHSYVLINSLDFTYDDTFSDDRSMPKNGLLIIILGMIFMVGNCAPEKDIWDFLNMMGIYAGREHFIYGEPRKLITRDWVQENYLEYQQVPDSDPPRYQFLWGPRAHAETSKLKVLEFLAKIKGTDPISFSCWYEEALRDEEERARGRVYPTDRAAAMFIAQRRPAAPPSPTEE